MPTANKPVTKRRAHTANKRITKRRAPPRVRPGTGDFMSVEELWCNHMPEKPRNQLYQLVASGVFPFVRSGRIIDLLRKPTLQILRGERPPGAPQLNHPARSEKLRPVAKRVTKKKPVAKSKPVVRKSEVAPAAVVS
jgi:hypothetical protein